MPQLRLKQLDGVKDVALDLQVVQWDDANKLWKAGRKNVRISGTPDANNDDTEGFSVGSIWVDQDTDNAYVCLTAATGAAEWLALSKTGEPYQETIAAENISGTDTVMATAFAYEPISDDSVRVYLNGQLQEQGDNKDYTLDHTDPANTKIKWWASTGTAVDMEDDDVLIVTYETLEL